MDNLSAVKCEACGDELPALARRNRRYCDARCRRRAFEARHAPPAIIQISDNAQAQVPCGDTSPGSSAVIIERLPPERNRLHASPGGLGGSLEATTAVGATQRSPEAPKLQDVAPIPS